MEISVQDLHNDMIKPYQNDGLAIVVEYVTEKILISDTILRSFILPQICKMTPKLCHICGCEICIIPKGIQLYLNIFRTRLITYPQQKCFGRHTRKNLSITTSALHQKDKVFPYGGFLHDTIKDVAQYIICLPIKPNNMINIKYVLVFCDECTEYNIPNEELDDDPNTSLIHFSVYTYQGRCETHGIIPNGITVCIMCEEMMA